MTAFFGYAVTFKVNKQLIPVTPSFWEEML